jgi:hypothetical protein
LWPGCGPGGETAAPAGLSLRPRGSFSYRGEALK